MISTREGNKSGYVGVSFHKTSGKWQARITNQGKRKTIGYYATPEEVTCPQY